jgi:hypothetical protein
MDGEKKRRREGGRMQMVHTEVLTDGRAEIKERRKMWILESRRPHPFPITPLSPPLTHHSPLPSLPSLHPSPITPLSPPLSLSIPSISISPSVAGAVLSLFTGRVASVKGMHLSHIKQTHAPQNTDE